MRVKRVQLRVDLSPESYQRFKAMQAMAGGTAEEVTKDAFRTYEEALNLAEQHEKAGGVVMLVVKLPDGSTPHEQPIFAPDLDS